MGGDDDNNNEGHTMTKEEFEATKPDELRKDIRMISGCADHQTSADVSNVSSFQLPDPAGRAGGALTSTLLKVLYADEQKTDFTEVMERLRGHLKGRYSQIPQLSSMNPIDVETKFDLVPDSATGTRRAVMIGINYIGDNPGELSGCHNDVLNMKKYIMDVHGFEEDNIVVLMDDGEHTEPTHDNIMNAYKKVIADAEDGDAIFLHYSGHGTKLRDDDFGEEKDGYDEALCPRDFASAGMIRDDDLYDILVKGCPDGVHMVSLMDCCHSGSIMDLPYIFKGDGSQTEMILDPDMNIDAFIEQITGKLVEFIKAKMAAGF
ncbi:predicted protein [Thalassiosira pseudonana CCMP1335]|uniref:Peptidase C14 caspase domain-containing protein n=1 Tax=Thalassiosira pseudonana TaxID=35128 RepID=B8CEU9_THAPS|nr:predicted protein [Thalassiosira pseudonana CCMP1335]EED88098.1 predicted protein [Thalassiosira pseudonana CCMP1335]